MRRETTTNRPKAPKNCSWRHKSTCENCGNEFAGRAGAANRFCKTECSQEFPVKRWLACSCCMAKIGIGSRIAGKLLGISPSCISRGWKKNGVIAAKLSNTGYHSIAKQIIRQRREERNAHIKAYNEACMESVRSHSAFPDWSILWWKESAKTKAREQYNEAQAVYERVWMAEVRSHNSYKLHPDWRLIAQRASSRKNPKNKMVFNLRRRLRDLIRTARNGGSRIESGFIGCSTQQLSKHLQSKFTKRMTWENYGTYWHVDHIIPCASFDHTDPKQRAACWHWTNLQPMEAKANLTKSSKITQPQLNLLLCATH